MIYTAGVCTASSAMRYYALNNAQETSRVLSLSWKDVSIGIGVATTTGIN